ncbi:MULTISPECIES: spore coat protein CotH [unclassified Brenneria]|uniref:carbapenem self-resistance protein CarG family protein n=1 Tax=unclassified Brenneria TaxID=2634434 RepID=UPI0029C52B60|nr:MULTISPECIES: spore coat protein CotH [unclassified Brenneria]MDX5630760.1 spore coat protein CotH [Brenneria sp. L3-3Z]MDX5697826.1 spore coat protein CotH [Brenneria sp. L4-2C]MEE3660852.1 spore coat protein CotH [Brenneria sp. g21c3]
MHSKRIIIVLMMLLSSWAVAEEHSNVLLRDGINRIDLNGDGVDDLLLRAVFDNNTSHPVNTLTIFIKDRRGNDNIVPVPDDAGFTWVDFSLSASVIKVTDYALYKEKGRYYMVSANKISDKRSGEDISDALPVRFVRYELKENDDDPGVPAYFWDYISASVTAKKYLSVDDAFPELNVAGKR